MELATALPDQQWKWTEAPGDPAAFIVSNYTGDPATDGVSIKQGFNTLLQGFDEPARRSVVVIFHEPLVHQQQYSLWPQQEAAGDPTEGSPDPNKGGTLANQESTWLDRRVGAWVKEVSDRFGFLLSLAPGWDGHEGVPIKDAHILAAGRYLRAVMGPETGAPAIVPTADGGLQLEWHQGGVDVEVLFSDSEDEALYVRDLAADREWEGPAVEGFAEFELASRLAA